MTKPLRVFIANTKILISRLFKKKWSRKPKNTRIQVSEIIDRLKKIDADGKYIYRGERKYYDKVSSGLYRQWQDTDIEGIDIEVAQKKWSRKPKDTLILLMSMKSCLNFNTLEAKLIL